MSNRIGVTLQANNFYYRGYLETLPLHSDYRKGKELAKGLVHKIIKDAQLT